jgi:hypothetical protein
MLSPTSYTEYLESLVLSLLAERPYPETDILGTDETSPTSYGYTYSPINVNAEIRDQRAARVCP